MTNPNNWPDPDKPGVPLNPDKDGWHWCGVYSSFPFPIVWRHDGIGFRWENGYSPEQAAHRWRYLGPCLTPAEVAVREQAASSVACRMNAGELVKVMRLERRVQRQRRALSRLYARRHEWKEREQAARREGMEKAAKLHDEWARDEWSAAHQCNQWAHTPAEHGRLVSNALRHEASAAAIRAAAKEARDE